MPYECHSRKAMEQMPTSGKTTTPSLLPLGLGPMGGILIIRSVATAFLNYSSSAASIVEDENALRIF